MESPAANRKKELITALSVLILIVVIVTGVIVMNKKSGTDTASMDSSASNSSNNTSDNSSATDSANNGGYKDGTYSAESGYNSPGGFEDLTLKVTIAGNKVTDAAVTTKPTDNEAEEYQNKFLSAYKQLVVGKSVNDIKLSRVSGSSLTSNGFNSALTDIKKQAANS